MKVSKTTMIIAGVLGVLCLGAAAFLVMQYL